MYATGSRLTSHELVSNGRIFLLTLHSKKSPIKKADIIKISMNNQAKDFKGAIQEICKSMDEVFGYQVHGIKTNERGVFSVVPLLEANNFILTNHFPKINLFKHNHRHYYMEDYKKIAIRIVLSSIYIKDKEISEDEIWHIITKMEIEGQVSPRREDLHKFLKSEAVDTMYLNRKELKNAEVSTFWYTWGIRADLECNKYEMLKHLAESIGVVPQILTKFYGELKSDMKYKAQILLDEDEANTNDLSGYQTDNEMTGSNEGTEDDLQEIPETQYSKKMKKRKPRVLKPDSSDECTSD